MDDRCPRGLDVFPDSTCALAVQRLRAIQNDQGNAKNIKVGCDWYIKNEAASYCFFKYMAENEGKSHDTINVASLLNITQAAVSDTLKSATVKVREAGIGEMILGEDRDQD